MTHNIPPSPSKTFELKFKILVSWLKAESNIELNHLKLIKLYTPLTKPPGTAAERRCHKKPRIATTMINKLITHPVIGISPISGR
jgi:hypothetical protein